ncbi:MAG: hypothetical protein IJG31_06360 [Fusobacterium sp.]|nr:hypothetical protein [Fusobacterium sp.]
MRNPILSNVFFRFKYIEKFGTGIKRIKKIYEKIYLSQNLKFLKIQFQ